MSSVAVEPAPASSLPAARIPGAADHVAVVHGGVDLTYAELHERAGRLASSMSRAGFGPGDRALTRLAPCSEAIEILVAVSILGGGIVDVSSVDEDELALAAERSRATWAFGEDASWPQLRGALAETVVRVSLDVVERGAHDYETLVASGRRPALGPARDGAVGPARQVGDELYSTAIAVLSAGGTVVLPAGVRAPV